MGFWSVRAAGEINNKSPSCLVPAHPLLAHKRYGGLGKTHCLPLQDGNLLKHHWEMTEPDAILLTTGSEVQEQSGLFIANNECTGK